MDTFFSQLSSLSLLSITVRLLLTTVFAGTLGYERERHRQAAGFRTYIIVADAAALVMMTNLYIGDVFGSTDLVRMPASVITGLGFLGAGTILVTKSHEIKGLTTSVGLWCCGIVGLALGAGLYTLALVLFLTLLCSMSGLPALETHLKDRSNHFEVHLELKNKLDLPGFVSTVRALGIRIDDIESNPAYLNSGLSVFTVSFTVSSAELKQYKKHGEIIEALRSLDYVYYIEEMN